MAGTLTLAATLQVDHGLMRFAIATGKLGGYMATFEAASRMFERQACAAEGKACTSETKACTAEGQACTSETGTFTAETLM